MSRVKHQNIVKLYGVVHNPVSSYTTGANKLFYIYIWNSDWLYSNSLILFQIILPNKLVLNFQREIYICEGLKQFKA